MVGAAESPIVCVNVPESKTVIPAPIETFSSLPWASSLSLLLHSLPPLTPRQKALFPLVASGRNIHYACSDLNLPRHLILPVLNGILRSPTTRPVEEGKAFPVALFLLPSRETSLQWHAMVDMTAQNTGLSTAECCGGLSRDQQLDRLRQGVDVLVATPGRLLSFVEEGALQLSCVRILVIEETNRLLEMGFDAELSRIMQECNNLNRQTLLSSSTINEELRVKSTRLIGEHVSIELATSRPPQMRHDVRFISQIDKQEELWRVLQAGGMSGPTIIFVSLKRTVDNLVQWLTQRGAMAVGIHGDYSVEERQRSLALFGSGEAPFLVATNVASRGDFRGVLRTINFDCPVDIDDYIARGSRGGSHITISFVTSEDTPLLPALRELLERDGQIVDWPSHLATPQPSG